MKKNMGSADRLIRILLSLAIGMLYLTDQISGTTAIILGVVFAIFVATSMVSFCPLYWPFKISTRKKQS